MMAGRAIATAALAGLAALIASFAWHASPARANGAFPGSLQLLLPLDRPQQIALATNFGLILSDDGGATWTWTCEQREAPMGTLFAVGPPPRDRFFAITPLGLAYSDDDSCSWNPTSGSLAAANALSWDVFPDPADADHVLAIGSTSEGPITAFHLYESRDGGTSFGDPLYTAETRHTISGVESAASDPATIYLAIYATVAGDAATSTVHPSLARTSNGGVDWTTVDLEPFLGTTKVRIISVDPRDPLTVILRVIDSTEGAPSESVAISHDGGATFKIPVTVPNGVITSFARLPDGTLLVGAASGADGLGFRSTDGGESFQAWTGVPHLQALGVRDGRLYAAAKNYTDKWAVGVSDDGGAAFTHFITYEQISRVRACVQAVCQDACDATVGAGVFGANVCYPDGGGGTSGGGGGSSGGGGGSSPEPGCGCGVGPARLPAGGGWPRVAILALAAAVAVVVAGRRSRG